MAASPPNRVSGSAGPPYFWFVEVASPAAGKWQARLARERAPAECSTITREIAVLDREPARPRATAGSVWPVRNAWNRATENLYSAWIEKLFDAPLDAAPSWKALHDVLRDRSRNVLFNHLGLREDEMGLFIRPDCADLPYFLRAYFAFKMALPFGYAKCTRGSGGEPPKCHSWWNIQNEEPRPAPPEEIVAAGGPLEMFSRPGAPPASVPRRGRDPLAPLRRRDLRQSPMDLRRGRRGSRRVSVTICASASPTASTPDPGERGRTTTTPTTIPCR